MDEKKEIIICEHVSKTFATAETRNEVVRDLNLTVKENEFVVLAELFCHIGSLLMSSVCGGYRRIAHSPRGQRSASCAEG